MIMVLGLISAESYRLPEGPEELVLQQELRSVDARLYVRLILHRRAGLVGPEVH